MNRQQVYVTARGEGGYSIYRNINLVATGVNIKATQGAVGGYLITNNAAAVRYVKFYDKATAPTVGTDTPVVTFGLPASSAANVYLGPGIQFLLGIGIAATNLVADADATAPTANDVVVNVFYK